MFLFQILSRLVCVVSACMLRGTSVSLGSYHTETHHYSPLLLRIKIIIVKFLSKITTLKIQSDCFGVTSSRKRSTDCSLQQTLPVYYHTWHWNAIKDSKFQPSLVDKKSLQNVATSGYFLACTIFILLAWGPHLDDFNIYSEKRWIFMKQERQNAKSIKGVTWIH